MKTIGQRLKHLLAANNLSMKELAESSGVPYRSIQNYTSDKQLPGAEALIKLQDSLDADLNWLLLGRTSSSGSLINSALLEAIGREVIRQKVPQQFSWGDSKGYGVAGIVYNDLLRRVDREVILKSDISEPSSEISHEIRKEVEFYVARTKETIALYGGEVKKGEQRSEAEASAPTVKQTFNSEVNQVGGGDIHNYSNKDK